jgi:hypothetical protein
MKVTKAGLRRIIREAVRCRLDHPDASIGHIPGPTTGQVFAITKDLLANLIDEECSNALAERRRC